MTNRPTTLVTSLQTGLTSERLAPYLRAAGGNIDRALDLYEWNTQISAALFADFSYFEVILRNACHRQLQQWVARQNSTAPWYRHPALTTRSAEDVTKARNRATRGRRQETEGRVVAELMFGFWRFLHSRSYEATLWTPSLRHAYPHQTPRRRSDVYNRLDHLNTLRNRIAHHEPIHGPAIGDTGKDIAALHDELLTILKWIDPTIEAWLRTHSTVPHALQQRP
ncbi:hypothetical protein AXA44_23825 [Rhodococcus sp. SC4]|nr:hypothetical protein AXA44_23825 [Rhodococcus sp. SC4]